MRRTAKYVKIEKEDLARLKGKPYVECPYCKDKVEVGSMKGEFGCPTCGTTLNSDNKKYK